ncbi:MAG: hypothetical protein A2042_09930 [Candidatus Schekmanbacteria bacterium GWA2_38_11]|uniref:Cytochrome b561 bacterial/Ni-hydrogenase domain-containing protein n=1 Tax=Candidatus Schekmanbacteria bacterium GWA2_38_11 TaxID=1817876 RepID=A0A1F7RF81_9BACT|nr:MAG: hypothetical protein A2042_09930 [Candidatus Schekmanbacteria bacterium GWA2_38_11]
MESIKGNYVIRFALSFRFQHVLVFTSMIILALTGFALMYHNTSWGKMLIGLEGGFVMRGRIHRVFAIVLIFTVLWHFLQVIFTEKSHKEFLKLRPELNDFKDFIMTLKYYLRISSEKARFEKFNFIQKFQYWGVIAGTFIMGVTGIILWFKDFSMAALPKWVMDVTLVVHGYEGTLAFLVLFFWHQYNAHLNPDVFPMDMTWINGKMSLKDLQERHPLEYEKLMHE